MKALNKRGIELASSFLVILIVSIVILSAAGALTYKILCASEDKIASYDAGAKQALERRLASGASVVVADASKDADAPSTICGSGISGAEFLIGVRNDLGADAQFYAQVGPIQLEDNAGSISTPSNGITSGDIQTSTSNSNFLSLRNAERGFITIVVNVPPGAEPGRYIIPINVEYIQGSAADSYRIVNIYVKVS